MDGHNEKTEPAPEAEHGEETAADEPTEQTPTGAEEAPQARLPRDSSGEMIAIEVEEPKAEEGTEPAAEAEAEAEEDLREQLDKKQNQLLRVAADFDNFRKRSRRDAEDAAFRASKDVLENLLPVIDNLELALSHAAKAPESGADATSLREGVEMVLRQFTTAMEKFEVRPIESLGKPFDPSFHEALQQRETEEHPPGIIVEEYRRGYMLGDRLIRAAMVVVAKAPTPPAAADATDDDAPQEAPGDDEATPEKPPADEAEGTEES